MVTPQEFCPYKGLQPFEEEDRAYFFGRERDSEMTASNLCIAPLTVLYGASGVGKTSVLQAGVVPRLGKVPKVAVAVFRSWQEPRPISAIKLAILESVRRTTADKGLAVDAALPFDDFLLHCSRVLRGDILVIFDQFEEYFLYAPPQTEAGFDAEFARAVNRKEVNAHFLLSMREDGLSKLDRFKGRIRNLLGNTLRISHLNSVAAREAILGPLRVYNERLRLSPAESVSIEMRVVETILEQVQSERIQSVEPLDEVRAPRVGSSDKIETPFLQLVLTQLWRAERAEKSRVLHLQTFDEKLGGAKAIVTRYVNELLSKLPDEDRVVCSRIFRFLITPDQTKIALTVPVLASWSDVPEALVSSVLTQLARGENRILRSVAPLAGEGGDLRYEIFHDVLASAILDWRAKYLKEKELEKAAAAAAEREKQAAQEAAERERRVVREREFAQAQTLAREQQKKAEAESKAARRLRYLLGFATTAAAVTIVLAGYAWRAQRVANEQRRLAMTNLMAAQRERSIAEQNASKARIAEAVASEQARLAKANARQAQIERDRASEQARLAAERLEQVQAEREKTQAAQQTDELNRAASSQYAKGDVIGALETLQAALVKYREIGDRAGEAATLSNIGQAYIALAQSQKAFDYLQQALSIQRATGDARGEITTLEAIGKAYRAQGDFPRAANYYQEALAIARSLSDQSSRGQLLVDMAEAESARGNYEHANALYQEAAKTLEGSAGAGALTQASALEGLAGAYRAIGKFNEAEPLYRRALAIREKSAGPDSLETAATLNNLAALYTEQGKYPEAQPLYQRALAIREKIAGPDSPETAATLNNLATFYTAQGNFPEAEALYQRALEIRQKTLGPDSPDTAATLNHLAVLYTDQGKYAQAEPLYQRSLAIEEKTLGPESPVLASTLNEYAVLLRKMDREADAKRAEERAASTRAKSLHGVSK